jgi:hypothetical protein
VTWPIAGTLPRRCKLQANQIPPKKKINALETFSGDMGGYSVLGQRFKNTTPHLCGGDAYFERIEKHRSYRYIKPLRYVSMLLFLKSPQTLDSIFNYPVISLGSPARSSVKSRSITPDSTPNWTLSITFDLTRALQLPQFRLTFLVNHSSFIRYIRVGKPSRSFGLLNIELNGLKAFYTKKIGRCHSGQTPALWPITKHRGSPPRCGTQMGVGGPNNFLFQTTRRARIYSAGSFCLPFLDQ